MKQVSDLHRWFCDVEREKKRPASQQAKVMKRIWSDGS